MGRSAVLFDKGNLKKNSYDNMKTYLEFNREERFYCSLYSHALLSSELTSQKFSELIKRKYDIFLTPDDIEVYVEVAALRDYWNDLGNPKKYSEETHLNRLHTIETILYDSDISTKIIETEDFFWTKGKPKKIWIPSHWNLKDSNNTDIEKLKLIKWSFNAKPDILIKSKSMALLIEAKFESKEGRDGNSGYEQFKVQEKVAHLMKLLIPYFQETHFLNTVLSVDGKDGISWKELFNTLNEASIDKFTWDCFQKFR
ncbi:MAG: hypothetical protein H6609_19350 [Ignavibacteriales bacterium]|nr:hypothetical protein [Ignavibacteriales bacterium]